MRSFFLPLFCFCLLSVSLHVQAQELLSAQVAQAVTKGPFSIGIGSLLNVNSQQEVFLGQLLNHDGSLNSLMVLDRESATVKYIPSTLIQTPPSGMQNVLRLYAQQGGTCTGYALDDFLLQTHFSGFTGNGKLNADVATEEGRTGLLADTINQYYLVLQHRFSILGIMNSYGKKYNFSCDKRTFQDVQSAHDFIMTSLKSEMPILISFNIGKTMTNGPFKLQQMDQPATAQDVRLWLPRKIGDRNSGGHSVVAAGVFTVGDSDYAVMLDSDWSMPRVWELKEVLSDRTAIDEVEFYTCE